MSINFDMDGTIANLYAVNGWLEDLENENVRPYAEAKPMINFSAFAKQIHRLQSLGYEINIISWASKNCSKDFEKAIAAAKIAWLAKHLPSVHFNHISIVAYGTPKSTCGNGILFDDEERNRTEWKGIAYNVENILEILKKIS